MDEQSEAKNAHERSELCSNSSLEIDSQCFEINKTQEEACQEFVFDLDLIYDTISIENNLVCNRKWVNKFITTLTMIGLVIGPTFSGSVSDKIGRTLCIIIFSFITFGFALTCGCLGTYHWGVFAVFRTLSVIGSAGVGVTYFVLVMETIGPKYRPICGLLYISTTIGLGTIMLTFVVAFLKNWKYAQFFMAFTAIFVGFAARICNETPRWLYSVKKNEEAREALQRMAKWQGYRIDSAQFEAFEKNMKEDDKRSAEESEQNKKNIKDLIASPFIRKVTIILMLNQFVRGIINYGFLFNIGSLKGNIFTNNIFNNLMGIPAFAICACLINTRLGRIGNFIWTLYLAGLSSFLIFFGHLFELPLLVNISSYVGMFASTAATSVGYVYTAEVYPTDVRNVGVGCCSSFAMFGALLSPSLAILEDYVWWFPSLFNGVIAVIAGSLSFMLPETIGNPMTATTEEFTALYGKRSSKEIVEKYTKKEESKSKNGRHANGSLENPSFKDSEF
ncbi:unnamed protein product [Oikopleura dioica]|uniref:Major facilitator superfamily (MFS) profile domain-containing protein n=1 Tax=Oikopleura dioica TaxID=34765 RepID=E4XMV6_OIKDI|nr:unnamed protein product [Oikopleura dioica]